MQRIHYGLVFTVALIVALLASGCSSPGYEVVEVRQDAVDEAGITYDGVRVITQMDTVSEDELNFIASDLANNNEDFKDRDDSIILFVQNEEGTSTRSALLDLGDETYVELP